MGGSAVIIHARPGTGVPNSCSMVSQRIGLPVPQEAVSIFQLVQELHPCQGVGLAPDLGLDLLFLFSLQLAQSFLIVGELGLALPDRFKQLLITLLLFLSF